MRPWHRHHCCGGCGHHGHHRYHGHHGHRHHWRDHPGYGRRWRRDEWEEPWPAEDETLAWKLDELREAVERLTDRLDEMEEEAEE